MRVCSCALVVMWSSIAAAAPPRTGAHAIVVGRVDAGAWSDAATEARADQHAELAVIVVGQRGKQRVVLAPDAVAAAAPLRLAGRAITTAERAPLAELGAVQIQWSVVEPHGFRVSRAPNGATSDYYSNVSTEPGTFGHWLGYDHIDYYERVVRAWSGDAGAATIPATISSGEDGAMILPGLGTVRYKVELALPDGSHLASQGAEAADNFGVATTVHRVSIRADDDFLGWLTAYLLVPEVFGSAGGGRLHQTERFTGADCADVMVGALRRTGRTELDYTNVEGLPAYATTIARATELDDHGNPARPITGVKRGDLIRLKYGGGYHPSRAWDHVAALWEDRSDPAGPFHGGPDGQLDGFDLVIHMGHPRLKIEPLAQQSPSTIDVLRWRPRR